MARKQVAPTRLRDLLMEHFERLRPPCSQACAMPSPVLVEQTSTQSSNWVLDGATTSCTSCERVAKDVASWLSVIYDMKAGEDDGLALARRRGQYWGFELASRMEYRKSGIFCVQVRASPLSGAPKSGAFVLSADATNRATALQELDQLWSRAKAQIGVIVRRCSE